MNRPEFAILIDATFWIAFDSFFEANSVYWSIVNGFDRDFTYSQIGQPVRVSLYYTPGSNPYSVRVISTLIGPNL